MTQILEAEARKEKFFTANRGIPFIPAAFSIAASWVWAPALFTSGEVAYKYGWQGIAWFVVPNVLVLILFAWFAARIRDRMPHGFTLSDYMRHTYSIRVGRVYVVQLSALAICSFAVQLIAGAAVICFITGWGYLAVTAGLTLTALVYSFAGGLKASVTADFMHIALTLLVVLTFAPAVVSSVGLSTVAEGLSSADVDPWALAVAFGIPTAIGLMSGPFGDQSFWTRSFAIKRTAVAKSFVTGGFIFATVPLLMATLGAAASGSGIMVDNPQLANVIAVQELLPSWAIVPFAVMVIVALVSTMDNNLISFATLTGHDMQSESRDPITSGRIVMVIAALVALGIANVPGITVTTLFLIYGTLRATTLAPTIITLWRERPAAERGIFWGTLIAAAVGLPVFIYGSFTPGADWAKPIGSVLVIGISFAIVLTTTRLKEHKA